MNPVSKICVLFLGWLVIGFVAYVVMMIWCMIKVAMLDPEVAEENFLEWLSLASHGFISRDDTDEDMKNKVESATGLPFIVNVFLDIVKWSRTIANVHAMMREAYNAMKDEYDRGIRIRKEKESS